MVVDTLPPTSSAGKFIKSMLSLNFKNYQPDDIRQIRENLDMSRGEFGKLFHSTASTVKSWELGERAPGGAAMRVLRITEELSVDYNSSLNVRIRRTYR